jgi:hypothetical protein
LAACSNCRTFRPSDVVWWHPVSRNVRSNVSSDTVNVGRPWHVRFATMRWKLGRKMQYCTCR